MFTLTITCFLACVSLTEPGKKVQFLYVSANIIDLEKKEKELFERNCKFIKNIKADIGYDLDSVVSRLIIGLRNKAAEVGGNVFLSSLTQNFGTPIWTKGKVYSCPQSLQVDDI